MSAHLYTGGYGSTGNVKTSAAGTTRPTSAGATRSRSGSFGYNRHNTGTSNLNNATSALLGHGYTSQNTARPSSAGHSRRHHQHIQQAQNMGSGSGSSSSSHHQNQNLAPPSNSSQPIAHILNAHQIPSGTGAAGSGTVTGAGAAIGGGVPHSQMGTSSSHGYSRPKSAGAVRRAPTVQADPGRTINLANVYGTQQYAMYAPQPQTQQVQVQAQAQAQAQAAAVQKLPTPHLNHYNGGGGGGGAPARPLSANATSMTSRDTKPYLPTDHWSTTYKAHYGYSAASNAATEAPQGTQGGGMGGAGGVGGGGGVGMVGGATAPQAVSYGTGISAGAAIGSMGVAVSMGGGTITGGAGVTGGAGAGGVRPTSGSATASKLRQAVQQDVVLNTGGAGAGGGTGTEEDDGGLDGEIQGQGQVQGGGQGGHGHGHKNTVGVEDEEMDGKPVDLSRSHPEISMTTPSASLELGQPSTQGVDVRNTSLDSFSEDHIQVGLSTVPNQFCTKRDAIDLKKLLALSQGTRGGIVPSSSAVMDMYMVGKVVGVGSYGKVRAAWHRLTSSKVAIKTYDKSKLKDPAHWKRVHSEIKIMEQVSHPRIARMYEAVETPKRMHLIMECLDGGNLCSYVKAKRRLSEEESKRIFFQIAQALEHLHSLGVSHRDIKLENVLFENDRDIKLIDFGFSTVCQPGKKLKVFCGTPSYMAPEIVRRSEYEGKPVDMWSMGILLYALLCGCFPFRAKAYPDLYRRIARGTFPMPEELSAPVKDLLRQLLNVDAATRINAHSCLRHSWLQVQLINAPNMDRIRLETAILISEKPADDLDEEVICELEKFGMPRDEVVRLVLTKTHSSLATLYYLLLDTIVNRRKARRTSGVVTGAVSRAKYVPAAKGAGGGQGGQMTQHDVAKREANAAATAQHRVAEQMAYQLQQQYTQQQQQQQQAQQAQQQLDRQEYRLRPKSAAQTRSSSTGAQRPLSAYAGRR